MKKHFNTSIYFVVLLLFTSCYKGVEVDLIVHNAKIHTLNMRNDVFEAMAIKDGKIVELGPERAIMNKYSGRTIDAEKREIYPGFYNSQAHLFSYAKKKTACNLSESHSIKQVYGALERYVARYNPKFIMGYGWNQINWLDNELPNNDSLNQLFPNTPVILFHADGNCILANNFAITKAGISGNENIKGGKILQRNGVPTGVFLGNATKLFKNIIPTISTDQLTEKLLEVQEEFLQYGITNIHEAGISVEQFKILQTLEKKGKLKLNIYAMLSPSEASFAFAKKNGVVKSEYLHVRSFYVPVDGALSYRGALLSQPYKDDSINYGLQLYSVDSLKQMAEEAYRLGYQMNFGCTGDSASYIALQITKTITNEIPDHRWGISNATMFSPNDLKMSGNTNIIIKTAPTSALSNSVILEDRIGKKRENWCYLYKTLLSKTAIITIGSHYPIGQIDPFLGIEALVNRKNAAGEPRNGFMPNEALSIEQCMKAMCLWSALASFEENEQGTLEPNKDATFVILYNPMSERASFINNYAKQVFMKGKSIYLFE